MITGIYVRVSTDEQAKDGFSIHAQKEKLTKYCEVNDWIIGDYYIDDGISGKNLSERPEVTRLIEDVKSGKITNVLVYKLDRLTRSVKDLIYLIELFDTCNCTFNSQTEKIDTSNAVGRMFVKIIGIFAEFERENLAERVSFGYEQKTREGNYTNCNGVFGYDYIIGKGKLKVNPEESKYVRKVFDWYLNGKSMLKIAKRLKELDVPTKRGGHWNQSTISSILTNPLYIGNVRYGVGRKNSFEVAGNQITPLISENVFSDVQDLIIKRKKFKVKKYSSDDSYYSCVLRCSRCGKKINARQQIQSGKKYITYRCNGCSNNSCDSKGFSHNKLEEAFIKYLDGIDDFEFDSSVIQDSSINENTEDVKRLEQEIIKLEKKKESIMNLFTNDDISYDDFKKIRDAIDNKLITINNEIDSFNKNNSVKPNNINQIKSVITSLKNNFINLNNHEKKVFLERFINSVEVEKINDEVVIKNVAF